MILLVCFGFVLAAFLREIGQPHWLQAEPLPQRLLVLRDGRVITGTLTPIEGGYSVGQPEGEIVVPYNEVRCDAASLKDAYRKLRDALKTPSADDHLWLSKWCLGNKLYAGAEEQLRAALTLQPNRTDARDLLRELHSEKPLVGSKPPPITKKQQFIIKMSEQGELQPLGEMDRETAATFATKIHPMLQNNCARSGCHSQHDPREFRLLPIPGRGAFRHRVEANLRSTLRQLDPQAPIRSPLYARPLAMDGVHDDRVFDRVYRQTQLDELLSWIKQAKDYATPQLAENPNRSPEMTAIRSNQSPFEGSRGNQTESYWNFDELFTDVDPAAGAPREVTSLPTASQSSNDPGILSQILNADRPDAFDPNAFNEKHHGRHAIFDATRQPSIEPLKQPVESLIPTPIGPQPVLGNPIDSP